MGRRQETKAGSFASERRIAMQFAAFAFLGMAVGAPATLTAIALGYLPGAAVFELFVSTSFVAIGVTMVARILWAPFLDAHDPPLLGKLGRRRGWVALLLAILAALSIAVGVFLASTGALPAAGAPQSPVYLGLLLAAMIVAGGLFAAVDALRSVQPSDRTQGILAAGQYAGIVVPAMVLNIVTTAGGALAPGQSALAVTSLWVMTGFLAAGWLGLWLLPGKDIDCGRIVDLPRVRRLLASEANLSAGGLRLVAWLYGVFVCPVIDFFERHGPSALLALLVLLLSDIANNWAGVRMYAPYANAQTLARDLQSLATWVAVLNAAGLICGAALVLWLSPVRALAAALAGILVVISANTIAFLTAPAPTPLVVAYLIDPFAGGALFIVSIAVIARLVTPRFAAFQFCLLLVAALPSTVVRRAGWAAREVIGIVGTQMLFLFIAAVAIGLVLVLARRLEPGRQPAH